MGLASRHLLKEYKGGPATYTMQLDNSMTMTPAVVKQAMLAKAATIAFTALVIDSFFKLLANSMTMTAAQSFVRSAFRALADALTLGYTNIGYTTLGSTQQVAGAGYISLTRFVIPGGGSMHLAKITSAHRGDGTGGLGFLRPALYKDNAGSPGALIEMGPEVIIDLSDTGERAIDFPFVTNPFVSGSFFAGWWLGGLANHLEFYLDTGASGTEQYAAVAYSRASALGKQTIGGTIGTVASNVKVGTIYQALDNGTFTGVWIYCGGSGTGTNPAAIRPFIYVCSSPTTPTTLLTTGPPVSIPVSQAPGWVFCPVTNAAQVIGNYYHIGWWNFSGAVGDRPAFNLDTGASGIGHKSSVDTYSATVDPATWASDIATVNQFSAYAAYVPASVPPDPFPSPSLTNNQYTLYAPMPMMDLIVTRPRAEAGSATFTGALTKVRTAFEVIAASLTLTGALVRFASHFEAFPLTSTFAGALTRLQAYQRSFSGAVVTTDSMSRLRTAPRAVAATITMTCAMTKLIGHTLLIALAALTLTGVLAKVVVRGIVLAASAVFTGVMTKLSSRFRELDNTVIFSEDMAVGGTHHINFGIIVTFVFTVVKKASLLIAAPFLQTNPRMVWVTSFFRRFDTSATLTVTEANKKSAYQEIDRSITLTPTQAPSSSRFRNFDLSMLLTRGFTLMPLRFRLMAISIIFSFTQSRVVSLALRAAISFGNALLTKPAKFYVLAKSGLNGVSTGVSTLLSVIGLKDEDD